MMNQITIQPIVVNIAPTLAFSAPAKELESDANNLFTYWGVYLDDKYVTKTSTKEDAVVTKEWMEKWLKKTN